MASTGDRRPRLAGDLVPGRRLGAFRADAFVLPPRHGSALRLDKLRSGCARPPAGPQGPSSPRPTLPATKGRDGRSALGAGRRDADRRDEPGDAQDVPGRSFGASHRGRCVDGPPPYRKGTSLATATAAARPKRLPGTGRFVGCVRWTRIFRRAGASLARVVTSAMAGYAWPGRNCQRTWPLPGYPVSRADPAAVVPASERGPRGAQRLERPGTGLLGESGRNLQPYHLWPLAAAHRPGPPPPPSDPADRSHARASLPWRARLLGCLDPRAAWDPMGAHDHGRLPPGGNN